MSTDRDIESQQTALLIGSDRPRDHWRWIFLVLHARQVLISSTDKSKKGSLGGAAVTSSTSSYGVTDTFAEGNANLELTEIVEDLSTSTQDSVGLLCSGMNDPIVSDVKLQHAKIAQIVKTRDLVSLHRFGGVQGIAEALAADLEKGIPGDEEDLCCRRINNTLSKPQDPAQGFVRLVRKSCNSYIIMLLFVSAVMSIGFGIKQEGWKSGWLGGLIIFVAIIILVVASSIRDFWHENLMVLPEEQILSNRSKTVINVLRGGNWQERFTSDVVIGDIVYLRRGYIVPCDGLFISGEFLKLDNGSLTIDEQNPFLFYGEKVINGHGRMLVTSVGMNTAWGEMMSQITDAPSKTSLPAQLDKLSIRTQIIGLLISILILVVVFVHFELRKDKHDSGVPDIKGKPTSSKGLMEAIKRIFMTPSGKFRILTKLLTLVVGIMEGVPFIIMLAIFYWNKKALSCKAFAKELLACVSMGSVTTICTDKTGGLTLNSQEVDMCWIGEEVISEDSVVHEDVLEALCNGISTPYLKPQDSSSSAEDLLLSWATLKLGAEKEIFTQTCTIIDAIDLREERSGVLMRRKKDKETHMLSHWRGTAKTILSMCSSYYDSKGRVNDIVEHKRLDFKRIVEHMESKQLKTVAFAYKKVDAPTLEDNSLILIGLLGLKDTCCKETGKVIKACTNAGINVILISEDNVAELKDIGLKCGLLPNSDRLVLEGKNFRTDEKRPEMIDKICVIGNSLPSDKLLLVQCLKQNGHVVAMVGTKTNETPALKEANVGIAMGTSSSEIARESSDIIIWDGNFSSLVTILSCGRCVYDNIQKYIQLEVTMVIAGLLVTAITTIAFGDSPITAIQWFWANLIVSVLGGLALLTEPPSEKLMDRQPVSKTDPFITKTMWRNITTQALFQAAILVTFQYKSKSILRIKDMVSETMVFNGFVLCQVFNLFNAREPQMKNVFKGIHQNQCFWVAVSGILLLQVAFIETAHILVCNANLNGEQWGISLLIGILSLAIDLAAKTIAHFIIYWHTRLRSSLTGPTGMT